VVLPVSTRAGRLSGVRMLIVEDDADSRELLAEFMVSLDAEVSTASSGREGFVLFAMERPAIVVSDLWMPEGDGYEMIQRIRSLPASQGGATPAIAISAAENARKALQAGYQAFFAKPYDADRIADAVERFVRGE
jgi:CheY-like chemotaxis protein